MTSQTVLHSNSKKKDRKYKVKKKQNLRLYPIEYG